MRSDKTNKDAAAAAPKTAAVPPTTVDSLETSIRVTALGETDPVMWAANILHSSGRTEEIAQLVTAARERNDAAGYAVALGLLRLKGDRQGFEDLAVEFSVQNEQSPPVWLHLHDRAAEAPAKRQDIQLAITSLECDSIIEATVKLDSPLPVRVDLSKVSIFDDEGLDIFNEAIEARIARKERTKLVQAESFLKHLQQMADKEPSKSHREIWRFLTNAFILLKDRDRFNAAAARGGHGPAWVDVREAGGDAIGNQASSTAADYGIDVGDTLSKLTPDFARELVKSQAVMAAKRQGKGMQLNMAFIRRWTLADMPKVLAFVRALSAEGVKVQFMNLNEILCGLMLAFGVDTKAELSIAGSVS